HPGKKLLFMGGEFGQWREWTHEASLDWHLCEYPLHSGVQRWVRDLNHQYARAPALFSQDFRAEGFEWVDCSDASNSVIAFMRKSADGNSVALVVCNLTPITRRGYRVGVPRGGRWREVLNSDAQIYGGSGTGNLG